MKSLIISAITLAALVIAPKNSKAQDVKSKTYQAYVQNDASLWQQAVDQAKSSEDKYSLAMARYGQLNQTMSNRNEDVFKSNLDPTIEVLEGLIDGNNKWAEPKAILSSVYGLQMGYSPWKGMYLGSKSSGLIEKALRLDDQSPLVNKLYAGSKLFTPEMFGGDVNEAIEYFEKSIELYEASSIENEWLYLDAMAFLGVAYNKNGQPEKSVAIYEKALEVEPEFGWVKYSLLPNAKKELAAK